MLTAALCLLALALGYALCGLVHRAAWDAERRTLAAQWEARWQALNARWARYYATVARSRARIEARDIPELYEPIRRRHG